MADRLAIYRGALQLLGNAAGLSSLTEVSAARNALDSAWQDAGDYMLTQGLWNFSIRAVELSNDEDVAPLFGLTYAFSKPTDWVRTASISSDGTFVESYENYEDETGYWYANIDPLYVRYVSDDDEYGWNVAAWRQPFAKTMEAFLAFQCGLPISSDRGNRNDLYGIYEKRLKNAKTLDAVDERVQFSPRGRLVRSRLRSFGGTDRNENN
ncbi:hypothetical protein [Mesorhizobium sp. ESP-6-2]|uniref:hypothetical protein n=1 Tax=Mesorhizobium sp. ESP-6-2 TaxID=2876625 RepID=UPI001CCDB74C|nr:hypothetical protein [Mesorhizobium sp. ESP-6-2]MBZ9807697.1 hypothetical protein [Mesorhizobium sp. ESP-6-2]